MTQFKLRSALLFTLWMVNPYSVWAEGGGSDQQSNPIPFQAALGAKKELTEAEEKIDLKTSYQDGRVETFIHVKTLASLIAEYLDHPTRCIAVSHSSMPYDKSFRAELDRQFVKIPEGRIRKNVGKVRSEPDFKNVKSFHAMRYAVTRSLLGRSHGRHASSRSSGVSPYVEGLSRLPGNLCELVGLCQR